MSRCKKHVWVSLIPKASELNSDDDKRISYFIDIMGMSILKRAVICTECKRTGHKINSFRGGVRLHDSGYFLNEAKILSAKYGFELPIILKSTP